MRIGRLAALLLCSLMSPTSDAQLSPQYWEAQCKSLYRHSQSGYDWCMEIRRANPNSQCGGDNLPCGNRCFNPNSGQACVSGNVICTQEGQNKLLCSPTSAQRANPSLGNPSRGVAPFSLGAPDPSAPKIPGNTTRSLEDRYKQSPAHKSAALAIFKGTKHPIWIKEFKYGGWGGDGEAVTLGGAAYEFFKTCKPRDCSDKQLFMLITPDGQKAYAAVLQDDDLWFFGNPQGAVLAHLETWGKAALAFNKSSMPKLR